MVFIYRDLLLTTDRVQFVDLLYLNPYLQPARLGGDTAVKGKEANLVGVVQPEVDGVFVVRRLYETQDSILRNT